MRSPLLKLSPAALRRRSLRWPASRAPRPPKPWRPLPASNYGVRAACSEPPPGFASCLALQLVPLTAEARRHTHPLGMVRPAGRARPAVPSPKTGELGLRPQDLHSRLLAADDAPIGADDRDRRRLQRPDRRSGPEDLQRRIRPAAVHESERLLQPGQPESGHAAAVPENGRPNSKKRRRRQAKQSKKKPKKPPAGGRDLARHRDRARHLPELPHPARRGRTRPRTTDLDAAELRAEALGATEISNSWGAAEEGDRSGQRQHRRSTTPAS